VDGDVRGYGGTHRHVVRYAPLLRQSGGANRDSGASERGGSTSAAARKYQRDLQTSLTKPHFFKTQLVSKTPSQGSGITPAPCSQNRT
jgi:hypothetical protein